MIASWVHRRSARASYSTEVEPTGFSSTVSAPACRAFSVIRRSSRSTLAETTTMGGKSFGHDPLRGFKTVHAGQPDVHRNNIRRNTIENAQGFFCASHRACDLEARVVPDDMFEKLPDHSGILDDENAYPPHLRKICPMVVSNSAWSNFRFTIYAPAPKAKPRS